MSRLLRDAWFQMFAGIAALCLVIMAVDWLAVHGATRTPLDVARDIAASDSGTPETPPAMQPPPSSPPDRTGSPLPIPPQDHDARTPSPAGRASPKEPGSWLVSLFPGPRIDTTSLADAVARAKNGDTIRLRPGRYLETVATNGKSLIIKGEGTRPEDVVLESAQPITLTVTKGSVVLENITISHRKDPAAIPFAGRSAAIFVSGAKLVLKNATANGWGAALQAAQDQDPAVIEASSSRLSGTIADLLIRGKARVDFTDVTFNNTLQPIVAWRDVELLLRACRFPAAAGTRLYVYGNSRARFADMERSPRVVSERAADAARADEAAFSTAGEAAAPAAQNAPLRMIRRGGLQKWKKDIFGRKTR